MYLSTRATQAVIYDKGFGSAHSRRCQNPSLLSVIRRPADWRHTAPSAQKRSLEKEESAGSQERRRAAWVHGRMVPGVELHMEAVGHVVEDIARVGDRGTFLVGVRRRKVAGMVPEEARHMVPVLAVEGMGYEVEHCTAVVAVEDIRIAVVGNLEEAHIQALVSHHILAGEDIGLQVVGRYDNPLDSFSFLAILKTSNAAHVVEVGLLHTEDIRLEEEEKACLVLKDS